MGVPHFAEHRRIAVDRAEGVVNHEDLHSGFGPFDQRVGESAAGIVAVEDVGFEADLLPRVLNLSQRRGEALAVLEETHRGSVGKRDRRRGGPTRLGAADVDTFTAAGAGFTETARGAAGRPHPAGPCVAATARNGDARDVRFWKLGLTEFDALQGGRNEGEASRVDVQREPPVAWNSGLPPIVKASAMPDPTSPRSTAYN